MEGRQNEKRVATRGHDKSSTFSFTKICSRKNTTELNESSVDLRLRWMCQTEYGCMGCICVCHPFWICLEQHVKSKSVTLKTSKAKFYISSSALSRLSLSYAPFHTSTCILSISLNIKPPWTYPHIHSSLLNWTTQHQTNTPLHVPQTWTEQEERSYKFSPEHTTLTLMYLTHTILMR